MKCKECGSELMWDAKVCPQCGAAVTNGTETKGSFAWNVQDFPKPKKKASMSIDWSGGRIVDNDSGKVYSQNSSMWSEPEEVKNLFSFDKKKEDFQAELDRQMETIAAEAPVIPEKVEQPMTFDLPSSMDMGEFADLLDDDVEFDIVNKNGEELLSRHPKPAVTEEPASSQDNEPDPAPAPQASNAESAANMEKQETVAESSVSDSEKPLVNAAAASAEKLAANTEAQPAITDKNMEPSALKTEGKETEASNIEIAEKTPAASVSAENLSVSRGDEAKSPVAAATDEKPVVSADQERVEAGKVKDSSDGAGAAQLSEEELAFNGLKKLMAAEERFKADMERVTYLSEAESAKAEKLEDTSSRLSIMPSISFRSLEDEYEAYRKDNPVRAPKNDDQGKEVEIKINEPSGTMVTVKTQEINLKSALENDKTQEVNLDSLRTGPKNVQVSVEVNAVSGGASVEVTRRHDGATLVKTIDEASESEHVYVNDPEAEPGAVEVAAAELASDAAATDEAGAVAIEKAADATSIEKADGAAAIEKTAEDAGADKAAETGSTSGTVEFAAVERTAVVDATDESADAPAGEAAEAEPAAGKDAEADAQASEDEVSEQETATEEEQTLSGPEFWERPADAMKMTITDIFGPEARKIIEQAIKGKDDESTIKNEKLEQSLILDIDPEDIAITKEQTMAIQMPTVNENTVELSPDDVETITSSIDDATNNANASNAASAANTTNASNASNAANATNASTTAGPAAASDSGEAARDENPATAAEPENPVPSTGTEPETAAAPEQATAEESTAAPQPESPAEPAGEGTEVPELEPIMVEDADDEDGFGGLFKALIILFVIILIGEGSVLGIKLLAPSSAAAESISSIEHSITSIFTKEELAGYVAGSADQAGTAAQTEAAGEATSTQTV